MRPKLRTAQERKWTSKWIEERGRNGYMCITRVEYQYLQTTKTLAPIMTTCTHSTKLNETNSYVNIFFFHGLQSFFTKLVILVSVKLNWYGALNLPISANLPTGDVMKSLATMIAKATKTSLVKWVPRSLNRPFVVEHAWRFPVTLNLLANNG